MRHRTKGTNQQDYENAGAGMVNLYLLTDFLSYILTQ
jgi:hypothetical protein